MRKQTAFTKSIASVSNSRNRQSFLFTSLAVACLALRSAALAQDCRDGCDAGLGNTFLGINALMNATGIFNTGVGENTLDYSIGNDIFFSSRRRHTICYRDWSSDVCSSD